MPTGRTRKTAPTDGLTREERTRKEILAATRGLVERHGFAKVTLEDIAGALGKKKSFLYYYYADKEEILAAAIEAEAQEMQREVELEMVRARNGLEKLTTFILASHHGILKRTPLLARLRSEIQAQNRDTLGLVLEKSSEMMKMDLPFIGSMLRQGCEDGSIRPMAEAEIEATAHLVTLTLHGIEYEYILGDAEPHLEDKLRIALRILERGIAP